MLIYVCLYGLMYSLFELPLNISSDCDNVQTIPVCMDISVTVAMDTGDEVYLGMHGQSFATLKCFHAFSVSIF